MCLAEMYSLIKKLLGEEELYTFAKTVLKAQDIKEESWNFPDRKYHKTDSDAARLACQHNKLDDFWIPIVKCLNENAWNDSQDWAKLILSQ